MLEQPGTCWNNQVHVGTTRRDLLYPLNLHCTARLSADVPARVHFCFKCPFLHLLILLFLFHTFLELKTLNKHYTLRNGSEYRQPKFPNTPPTFTQLILGSCLNLSIVTLCFRFWNNSFQTSASINWTHCATKFRADCTRLCHRIASGMCLAFNLTLLFRFRDTVGLSECSMRITLRNQSRSKRGQRHVFNW